MKYNYEKSIEVHNELIAARTPKKKKKTVHGIRLISWMNMT